MSKISVWTQSALLLALLSACAGHDNRQPLDFQAINAVEAEVKRQIGVYMLASTKLPKTIINKKNEQVVLSSNKDDYQCGDGNIGFDILSVKADLLATTETDLNGSLGISPPIPTGTLGFTGGLGSNTTNTQELVFNLWFDPISMQMQDQDFYKQPIDEQMVASAPIAFAIINLRNALIASGLKTDPYTGEVRQLQPCHWDWNQSITKPGGDPGDTMKFAITVVKDAKIEGKLNIYLVNLDLSADQKSTTGNTITVSFYQTDTLDATADKPVPAPRRRAGKPPAHKYLERAAAYYVVPVADTVPSAPAMTVDPTIGPSNCDDVCRPPNQNSRSCLRCKDIGRLRPPDLDSRVPADSSASPRRTPPRQ